MIDLSGATVLPGMIDTHIHLYDQQNGQSVTARAAVAIGDAARTLKDVRSLRPLLQRR